MIVKLLTEHHLEFLSFKGSCTGSSESTLVKMPHCWKSRVMAQMYYSRVGDRIRGSDYFSIGICTSISKKTENHFLGGGSDPAPIPWIRACI